MAPISAITLLKQTLAEFQKDEVPREAAALSYYAIFSIAPLLLVLVALGGIFLGEKAARGEIVSAVEQFTGQSGAEAIEEMIVSSSDPDSGRIALLIGIGGLILGASTASMHLKQSLNAIWQLPRRKKEGFLGMVLTRAISLTVVLGVGFILLASLALSTVISAIGARITDRLQGGDIMWRVADVTLSVAVITLLFGMLYKFLPDLRIAWKDVWLGGFFTAMLFVIGKLLLGVWLGAKSFDSTWGAAASFAILLVWIYYSSIIFFFGAEFTQVHAKARGHAPEHWQEEESSADDEA
ncbi:MAG: YihY/virulence factor BrkB family protein [Thermoanaerobaculia bacterium]